MEQEKNNTAPDVVDGYEIEVDQTVIDNLTNNRGDDDDE